jgi:hypothetical protein
MKWLICLLFSSSVFAADRAAILATNALLDSYKTKHEAPAAEHNRIMVFVRPQNTAGYIHGTTYPITRATDNNILFNIPNGIELRSCDIAPSLERVLIKITGSDSLDIRMIENKPIKISCTSQNLSKYFFISYKQ